MSGAETKRWRASWAAAAEAQWSAAGAGKYKESAAQFLISSWQGDALSVSSAGTNQPGRGQLMAAADTAATPSIVLGCIVHRTAWHADTLSLS